jgi:serine/threonine protein kinase
LRSPRPGKTPTRADPFTEAVASALAGEDGINLDGYLDYRGVYVIGAWAWLPDYDLGIVTELDLSEAQKPLWALRQTFAGLFILLVLAAAGVAIYHRVQTVTARRAARAERKAEELGQYLIEGKIGEGGMGVVYRARHRLLRRPTAIKMLRDSERDSEARERFEREVRTTCNLTHPNTIAVYDYGQTDDNSFYYAMEFLIGEDLENLVIKHGPMQSGRVIHILRQACGSLAEAHDLGLIHRDIKPANIYVCERGGLTDFVKVLDFGLVKSIKSEAVNLTAAEMICGTPQYMAPEIISQDEDETDGRVDIYSLACVGYFLLTGRPVFERRAVMDTLLAHINEEPPPPGQFRSSDLPDDLVELIMAALSKDPNVRPQSARAFEQALAKLADANSWDQQRACDWWRVNEPAIAKRQSTRVSDRVVGISLSRR